ncbi:hypothetical protein ZOSMA_14G00790 [Zostera marina]|uniref:Uncharacterized protein n=1 Tax=Zostera marina TaxID=29655 RepID=A0A0K9PYK6_ZOSMR|nr:hypothetical protein ZOSMA_14G00790 [Zostera marina]
MPGVIDISVLDLIDLPVPVTSSHSLIEGFVKVAMGKREYQSTGKGDFSFVVVSLRESLVFTVHDANGIQISKIDVKIMEVVEKGEWDSWFQFEGGGRIHLKMRFSLTKGDRSRVREMRESAKKRNYENLQRRRLPENLQEGGESKFHPRQDFTTDIELSKNRDTTSALLVNLQEAEESKFHSRQDFNTEIELSENRDTTSALQENLEESEESKFYPKQDFNTEVKLSENRDTTSGLQENLQEAGKSKFHPKQDLNTEVGLSENGNTTSGMSSYSDYQQSGMNPLKQKFNNKVGLFENRETKPVIPTQNDLQESVESSKQELSTKVRLFENPNKPSLISLEIDLEESATKPLNSENDFAKNSEFDINNNIEEKTKKPRKIQESDNLIEDRNNWKTIRIDSSHESRKSSNNSNLLLNITTQSDIMDNFDDDHMWIKRRICFTTRPKHLMIIHGDLCVPASKDLRTDKEKLGDGTNQIIKMIKEKIMLITNHLRVFNPTKIHFALQKYREKLIIHKVIQITLVTVSCGTLILIKK